MTNYLYALQRSEDVATSLESLEADRLAYRDSYAESQMIVPDAVSRASSAAKTRLNAAYGKVRKYGAAPSTYAEELATLEGQLHGEVWPYLGALKQCMRADLGVDD